MPHSALLLRMGESVRAEPSAQAPEILKSRVWSWVASSSRRTRLVLASKACYPICRLLSLGSWEEGGGHSTHGGPGGLSLL